MSTPHADAKERVLKVLVVGQTPPPFGGQAVMIEALLAGKFERVRLYHVRLAFSDDMESVGKFAFRKVAILFTTIFKVLWMRVRHRTPVLYYPPSGPNMVPVLRDIVLLNAVRWCFAATVFHFHAGGVSGFRQRLPRLFRGLYDRAYRRPSVAIRTAPENPPDGEVFGAVHDVVVPNGVLDQRGTVPERAVDGEGSLRILFTGVLIPSKGVTVLLEAFRGLVAAGVDARLELMGKWGEAAYRDACTAFVEKHGLADRVSFLGVLRDKAKLERFADCNIFCFPSHFEAESFGLVLVEAMQFARPVVSTRWRGIPSVVADGGNGILTEVEDPTAVTAALLRLARDPALRARMGAEGRRIFVERFTLDVFHRNMENALALAAVKAP